jgi:hypothetical protein
MTQTTILNESGQVVLDSNGNGSLTIGPNNSAQVWIPTSLGVQASSNVKEPMFKFYRGHSAGPLNYISGTTTGSNDNTDVNGITLFPGETFFCQWTGGDAGAIASVTIVGEIHYD